MLTPTKPVKSCECGGSCGGCCCCTKESIGLGNVDNTSDLNKPLSGDMINALSGKVDLDVFTQLKNRVLALENSIPDITALENRMTNAEANIVTLQSNYASLSQAISNLTATVNTLSTRVTGVNDALVTVDTRVDALESKDSNNVKLSGVNVQTIQGTLKANDPASGTTDKTLVTANWVSQTGNSGPNNLIHRSGNETRSGILTGESETPFISKTIYPEFLQNGVPTANIVQTFLSRLFDYNNNETCRFYERHLSNGIKYVEIYQSVYGSDDVLYHPFIRIELTNDNHIVARCSSRESTNIADYSNNEIVTVGTLKKLGLI